MPETGLTFAENALIKAREGCRHTGLPTVADDSGLAVDALNGMPGVFSARWSGRHGDDPANLDLVLAQLADVPGRAAGARRSSARPRWCCPTARAPRRRPAGRAADPRAARRRRVRLRPDLRGRRPGPDQRRADPAEKDAISHRGQAFRALAKVIAKELPPSAG